MQIHMTEKRRKYLNYTLIGSSIIVGMTSIYSLYKYRKKLLNYFINNNKEEKIDVIENKDDCKCDNCECNQPEKEEIPLVLKCVKEITNEIENTNNNTESDSNSDSDSEDSKE